MMRGPAISVEKSAHQLRPRTKRGKSFAIRECKPWTVASLEFVRMSCLLC